MSQFGASLFSIALPAVLFCHVAQTSAHSDLDGLDINFGSPQATLPLDRYAEFTFPVTNNEDHEKVVTFSLRIKETDQEVVGWPQPQVLYLDAGETETIKTFLDEKWGQLEKTAYGDQSKTLIWTFRDQEANQSRVVEMRFPITVLDPANLTGNLLVKGKVLNAKGKTAAGVGVTLSTGVGGYQAQTTTDTSGKFSFSNFPAHRMWFLRAGGSQGGQAAGQPVAPGVQCAPPPAPCNPPSATAGSVAQSSTDASMENNGVAFAFLTPGVTDYTLQLVPPQATAKYSVTKAITDEIGIWKGAVDDKETKLLVVQGMENWKDPGLKTKAQLRLYAMTGELLWAYDMGWEGWGVDLSADGTYAAFTTSNSTHNLGVLDATTGQPLWVKSSADFKWPRLNAPGEMGGIDSKEIAISSTNAFIGVGHGGGDIALADLKTGELKWHTDIRGQVRGILFDAADEYVYAGSGDGRAYKLKTSDGSIVWQTDIGSWPFTGGFKLSKDGAYLGSASKFGEVTVIETATGKQLWQASQAGNASWLDFSPDGTHVFAGGGGQGASTLYETKTGNKLWRSNLYSHQGRFSSDGKLILAGDQATVLYDLAGNLITHVEAPKANQLTMEGGGQFAYLTSDGKTLMYSHRDIEPGGTSLVFAQGSYTSTSVDVETASPVEPVQTGVGTGDDAYEENNPMNFVILGLFGIAFLAGIAFLIVRMRIKHLNHWKERGNN